MSAKWFTGNFYPKGTKPAEADPLKPETGPEIRSMMTDTPDSEPFLGEIRQFEKKPVSIHEWMKAEGQLLDLGQYITLYPIIGYLYGSPASREVFPLPNLNNYPDNRYYICVKNGLEPERP